EAAVEPHSQATARPAGAFACSTTPGPPAPSGPFIAGSGATRLRGPGLLLRAPAAGARGVPLRALTADLGRRALGPDVVHLLVDPVARIALGDDLLEPLGA